MKFKANLRPEEIVSKDVTRTHLTNVWFDKAKSKLVATNDHMLITVPCEPGEGDVTGPVPTAAIKQARRRKLKDDMARLRLGKRLADDGTALHRREQDVKYPTWEQVVPPWKHGDQGTVTIGVNPHYLVALMRAAGDQSRRGLVALTFKLPRKGKDMLDPIRVVAEYGDRECEMIVMPGRV